MGPCYISERDPVTFQRGSWKLVMLSQRVTGRFQDETIRRGSMISQGSALTSPGKAR